ncbi:5-(carboxyamino)imidazole ribonucleotide synthase [Brevibacillus laterosporus]|uniref:N5-carboxyaminoimidazole ribonucleotide synthase n=1 Tax=Brevibacillus laterosporus TaxID=1465 RepID=A0AAP3GCA7_BRELA|nr:5-(carboxyamino)imidazole ribonucleotide synthase [Brevibacillus laterosporus]MCR8982262.1 5-(carboxyamino)imidazole ribonucleotide synthase [Brevibacillus laterosporus]MCZ0809417.1 5-(carboxyamino)imidazole ribonucleotide synthase [Brevibacillus laterosporus]MCZ0827792.1 5-(carboxyamino)imidazole ribonucleotide synthase [Brevibacillus laterosporus]MCZ0851695.1 5-(carboxyamino)imidazole ribonucleotide synthase [Brevibacillus laterosporus]PPA92895.1 5-(carboxyamino)imidazole ribonucleotide s
MNKEKQIKPGSTIGLLGGGQLGRMITLAGRAMGYRFVVLDPTEDSPCGQVSDQQIVARYDDQLAARKLAQLSDVITYEFENIDAGVAAILEEEAFVPQGSKLLGITQHRVKEKTTLQACGLPVAPFRVVASAEDVRAAVVELGLPAVMKTATGGYDGKGQWVLRSFEEIEEAFSCLAKAKTELIVEKFVPFTKELSVIVARNVSGEIAAFPIAENIHRENILHQSIVPARIEREIQQRAERLAIELAEKLEMVGLLAVEMFLTEDGGLYINEMAPRPHNSGHYTMDACLTSQFEQHIRAISNLPLGSTKLLSPVVMVNILGEHVAPLLKKIDQLPKKAKLHLYGKQEAKEKRKMGHINLVAESVDVALQQAEKLGIWS